MWSPKWVLDMNEFDGVDVDRALAEATEGQEGGAHLMAMVIAELVRRLGGEAVITPDELRRLAATKGALTRRREGHRWGALFVRLTYRCDPMLELAQLASEAAEEPDAGG